MNTETNVGLNVNISSAGLKLGHYVPTIQKTVVDVFLFLSLFQVRVKVECFM